MRLPSYSYDKDDLARHLSVAAEGPEEVVEADEYLQPQPSSPHGAENGAKVCIEDFTRPLFSSADNVCKNFGTRSDPTEHRS